MKTKEKVKYLWFGEKPPLDTSIKTINVFNVFILSFIVFVFSTTVIFMLLWNNLPFFPLPEKNLGTMYQAKWIWLFWLSHIYQFAGFKQYFIWLINLRGSGEFYLFFTRYLISLGLGLASAVYTFRHSLVPTGGFIHVKGKQLFDGATAYNELFRFFKKECGTSYGSKLVVASEKPYNPEKDYIEKLPKNSYIELPERLRRTHSAYIGGTGRGKTVTVLFREIQQVHKRIAEGEVIKLFVVDTKKGDYEKIFNPKNIYKIAPTDNGGVKWDIGRDLTDHLLADSFWNGKIPKNDSDPIWSNAAVVIGTGCTKFLIETAGKEWNYGILAYMLSRSGATLNRIISEYYPEGKQILNAAPETLSSVLFNLSAYNADIVNLARIYDGFDTKQAIYQATANSLKRPKFVDFLANEILAGEVVEGQESKTVTKSIMFKGVCRHLNKTKPDWTWKDFADFVLRDKEEQALIVSKLVTDKEAIVIADLLFWEDWLPMCQAILDFHQEWDRIETTPKISIKDWILNENPAKKIFLLKPSETYPTLTEGLIKGILYFSNSIILGSLPDSNSRRFHILIDEFQSLGKIAEFVEPALQMYRSKGCSLTLAFQDLSQLVEIYGQEFVDFMNSSIGNIVITGFNDGFTSNKISELIGDRTFKKLHRTKSEDGKFSDNYQEHDQKVIHASEFNLLGAKVDEMKVYYLNLFSGMPNVYILTAPIIAYKTRCVPEQADWIKNGFTVETNNKISLKDHWGLEENISTPSEVYEEYESSPVDKPSNNRIQKMGIKRVEDLHKLKNPNLKKLESEKID